MTPYFYVQKFCIFMTPIMKEFEWVWLLHKYCPFLHLFKKWIVLLLSFSSLDCGFYYLTWKWIAKFLFYINIRNTNIHYCKTFVHIFTLFFIMTHWLFIQLFQRTTTFRNKPIMYRLLPLLTDGKTFDISLVHSFIKLSTYL